jgi:hypothetical protein
MSDRSSDPSARSSNKSEAVLDFLRSARRSTYTTVAGRPSNYFTDLDEYFLGHLSGDTFDPDIAQARRRWLQESVAGEILSHARTQSVSRLVFVEKQDAGPIGMLSVMNLILHATGLDACVLRPRKRLLVSSVKGRPILAGERMMIVSDVATTGSTILHVARRVRELGGVPVAAYVLHDRGEGALEALSMEGINLRAHVDELAEREAEIDTGIVNG